MYRLRRWSALAGLLLMTGWLATLRGQVPPPEKKAADKPAEQWLVDRALTVSPAPAPIPALKYRLYPSAAERKEGNAAPIYERFAHERSDARKQQLREKPEAWNKLPLDKLPLAEVRQFLAGYEYNFRQLELGAWRKTTDWNYTLDVPDIIGLLIPDAQEMRLQAPLLVLKARFEIAEHRYADAVRTLETGFSFSQQVGEGAFLINSLVGIACANQFADCLLELEDRPDAPNLYWALTVLPRPLIDMRSAMEFEQQLLEKQFPDMAELDRPHSPEQWDAALARVRREFERLNKQEREPKPPKAGTAATDPADRSPDLPAARKYLTDVSGLPAAKVEAMPPAQVLLLYLANYVHQVRDDVFKEAYLPFSQTRRLQAEAEEEVKSAPDTEAGHFVRFILPAIGRVYLSDVRIRRKLAAQRTIEALRMHAAKAGQFPDKLDQVTVVPLPNDPGTGQPFEYRRDGDTATLISRLPGQPQPTTGLRYRVTLRK
jgi:hypothetical protein